MRIKKENTIGLVIDLQERLIPSMSDSDKLVQNSLKLIEGFKILGVPIITTQQYTKGLGPTIPELAQAIDNFAPIEKKVFSCCQESTFLEVLAKYERKNVVIIGVEAHVCVLQTCLDLIYYSYTPVTIVDAISSRSKKDKKVALWRMRDAGGLMSTTESILFELCKESGTDEFKAISKLIK